MKLTIKQLNFYQKHGYLKIEEVVPLKILKNIENLISPWINDKILFWKKEGLLSHTYSNLNFWKRFLLAWRDAGQPTFRRNPNKWLINKKMYHILKEKVLLNIASQLLHTNEISVHGIFNVRPQLPDVDFAKAPWHQDSQYWSMNYGQKYDDPFNSHVLTFFIPLQNVNKSTGCLSVMSLKDTKKKLFKTTEYDFQKTGYLGLKKIDISRTKKKIIPMKKGDILIFNHLVPHGTNPLL